MVVLFSAMIRQFLSDVHWQDTEYLIIDTPPGTSDEHISVMENLRAFNPDGAILVTTPQVTPFTSPFLILSFYFCFFTLALFFCILSHVINPFAKNSGHQSFVR